MRQALTSPLAFLALTLVLFELAKSTFRRGCVPRWQTRSCSPLRHWAQSWR